MTQNTIDGDVLHQVKDAAKLIYHTWRDRAVATDPRLALRQIEELERLTAELRRRMEVHLGVD